jgi:hypothetical protein
MGFHRPSTALPSVIPSALHRSSTDLPTAFQRVCVPPPYTPMAKALALEGRRIAFQEASQPKNLPLEIVSTLNFTN